MDEDRTDAVTTNAPANETPPRRSRGRWRVFLFVVFLGGMVAAVLASGLPQRRLIPQTVQRALGAEVSMAVRSTWKRVELGDILLREPNAPELPPLLRAEGLSMPWTFLGPRHVPSLLVTGLEINLSGTDPQRTNYDWVKRFMAQPSSGLDLLPFTPVNITVAPIRLRTELPGVSFAVEGTGAAGLVLTATTESLQRYTVGLAGDDAEIRWTLPGIAPQTFSNNRIRVQVASSEAGYAAEVDLRLPKEDRIQGAVRLSHEGRDSAADVSIRDSVLRQPIWAELSAAFLPVRFTALECPDVQAHLQRTPDGWALEKLDLQSRFKGLAVGPVKSPWFFGDVQLASVEPPKDAQFAATALINDLPPVRFHWGAREKGWVLGAKLDDWAREQAAALLPGDWGRWIGNNLPFATVSIASELGPAQEGWNFSEDVLLRPAEGAGEPLAVQAKGDWAQGTLSGELKASMGEGTALAFAGLRYDAATGRTVVAVTGPIDLAPIAKMAGMPELLGTATVNAKFLRDPLGNIKADPFRAVFETLGWGGFGIPYGTGLKLSAPVHDDKKGLTVGPVEAALGEDTTFKAEKFTWSEKRLSASSLVLETGLAPLVSKGWLAAAEGHASARCAAVTWPGPGPQEAIEYTAAFARLDLPAGRGSVKGFTAKGQLNWGDAAAGSGTVAADEATAAGATLHAIHAAFRLYGAETVVEQAGFGLFGGTVKGDARLTPLDAALPVSFNAAVEKVDLDVFTREYKPPSTQLTGLVGGSVSASLDLNGLRALDVDLKSDGSVTMNRDLVEQLLASEYLAGMSGGKQVGDMLRDAVGDAGQIAFSGATVRLGLEDGRITGTARLESEKLNLTLDIKADPGALLEALRARSAGAAVEKAEK